MGEYLDILREFETKKRNFGVGGTESITFRIASALRDASEKYNKKTVEDKVAAMRFGEDVVMRGKDKLRVKNAVVKQWFDGPVNNIISHIKALLKEPKMKRVKSILLVGGFGESPYVQKRMKDELKDIKLIVPADAGIVVLKGAVRFGHEKSIVTKRVMAYSYGIRGKIRFNPAIHPSSSMIEEGEIKKLNNAFVAFVRAGDETSVGQEVTQGRDPGSNMQFTTFPVMRSSKSNPILATEEGCELMGLLRVDHPEGETKKDKKMDVTFIFGDTELMVKVRMRATGKEFFTSINCLE